MQLQTEVMLLQLCHVLLMFLVSIVVFVVGTYFFVIPRVIHQSLDTQAVQQQIDGVKKRVGGIEGYLRSQAAPAPAPAADPEPAPAPAPDAKAETAPDAKAAPAATPAK